MNKKLALLVSLIVVFSSAIFLYSTIVNQDSVKVGVNIGDSVSQGLDQSVRQAGNAYSIDDGNNPTNALTTSDVLKLKTFRLTHVDGKLEQDADGNLIINRDLRHWIDFYLSATGEADLEDLIALMKQEIARLDSPAKEQALEILLSYIGYKTALAEYDERESLTIGEMSTVEQVGDRLAWQKRLRREWLPAEAVEEFWLLDELIDDHAYQKLVIHNSDLSAAEKAQKVAELEQQLPQEFSEFKKSLTLAQDLMAKEKELIKQGRSEEVKKLREENLSPEAVERLEAFDQQQHSWHVRVMEYRDQLNTIEALEGVSSAQKQALINDYQQQHFDAREALRLPAAVQLVEESQ